jgi:hypothetical protein
MALHVGAAGPLPRLADLVALPFSAVGYGGEWGPLAAATASPRITEVVVFSSSAGASGGERGSLAAAVQGAMAYAVRNAAGLSLPPHVGGGGARREYCFSLLGSTTERSSDEESVGVPSGDYCR